VPRKKRLSFTQEFKESASRGGAPSSARIISFPVTITRPRRTVAHSDKAWNLPRRTMEHAPRSCAVVRRGSIRNVGVNCDENGRWCALFPRSSVEVQRSRSWISASRTSRRPPRAWFAGTGPCGCAIYNRLALSLRARLFVPVPGPNPPPRIALCRQCPGFPQRRRTALG
jgi:hypothetical protein